MRDKVQYKQDATTYITKKAPGIPMNDSKNKKYNRKLEM